MSDVVHVFILEDDERTRDGLVRRLEQARDIRIIGAVGTVAEARDGLSKVEADILLFDLQLPDGSSVDLIAERRKQRPDVAVLVISVFGDEERVLGAIEAGAQGYLLKDHAGDELEEALRSTLRGESPISPAIARHLIQRFHTADTHADDALEHPLSDRELEVLRLASKGLTYRETSELLGVSVNTVGTYTRRIYSKLAVTSRAQAIFEARALGLMGDRD